LERQRNPTRRRRSAGAQGTPRQAKLADKAAADHHSTLPKVAGHHLRQLHGVVARATTHHSLRRLVVEWGSSPSSPFALARPHAHMTTRNGGHRRGLRAVAVAFEHAMTHHTPHTARVLPRLQMRSHHHSSNLRRAMRRPLFCGPPAGSLLRI
jgi:hypothetical protein